MRSKGLQPGSTLPVGPGAALRSSRLRQRQLHDGVRSEPTADPAIAGPHAARAYLVKGYSTVPYKPVDGSMPFKCQLESTASRRNDIETANLICF